MFVSVREEVDLLRGREMPGGGAQDSEGLTVFRSVSGEWRQKRDQRYSAILDPMNKTDPGKGNQVICSP